MRVKCLFAMSNAFFESLINKDPTNFFLICFSTYFVVPNSSNLKISLA